MVTEDWAFLSHRLPMARAAKLSGCAVIVATSVDRHRGTIEEMGYRVINIPFKRKSINPLQALKTAWQLMSLFWEERPDIVHNIALKPILLGTLAARISPVKNVINTFTGMGAIFIDPQRHSLLRRVVIFTARHLFKSKNVYIIVQNEDDQILLGTLGIGIAERTIIIRGSGVDIQKFSPQPEPESEGPVRVTMVSRLLWDKGIGEVVAAARLLKERNTPVTISVVGEPDPQNPQSVDPKTIEQWRHEGVIDFQGRREDIAAVWGKTHIALLPSYREGMPKSLLEAAACARPIITTNAPGCRELVNDGVNGILVPVGESEELANAIGSLVRGPELRQKMGREARRMVEKYFSDEVVTNETKDTYEKLLKKQTV